MGVVFLNSRRRVVALLAAVLSVGGLTGIGAVVSQAQPAAAAAIAKGDLLLSVGSGKVEEYTPSGTLVQTLTSDATSPENTGSIFDKNGNFYVTEFSGQQVSKFDANGTFVGAFGSGYNADPESIVFDAAGNAYVGQADGSGQILKFGPTGSLLNSYSPVTEDRGTDWIDLESNGCTMQYTSEGTSIKQFDVCTNTQLPDFATGLPGGTAFAHRILPDGTVIVADSSAALRLNASGAVITTYTPAESVSLLFAMNLDPDGKSFWTADIGSGEVFHFDIATGAELGTFSPGHEVAGISVRGEITAVPKIELTPTSATNPLGANHTLTATATDGGGPAVAKSVTFKVLSGPNAGLTAVRTTSATGVATFTYTSSVVGTDTIRASFVAKSGATVTSNNATKTWTNGTNSPTTCVVTALRAGPPKQQDVTVKDADGIASIFNVHVINGTVAVPAFTSGTPGPVVLTTTKTVQNENTFWEFDVRDSKGATHHCV
jgi:hypothetical protein